MSNINLKIIDYSENSHTKNEMSRRSNKQKLSRQVHNLGSDFAFGKNEVSGIAKLQIGQETSGFPLNK